MFSVILFSILSLNFLYAAEPYCSPYEPYFFSDLKELTAAMSTHINDKLPSYKQKFCRGIERIKYADRLKASPRQNLEQKFTGSIVPYVLSFKNPPGPINEGMCWLHTKMQRNFTYLANFRPDLPRPENKEDIEKIIDQIIAGEKVTEIPGFENLNQFSFKYEKELTSAITRMGWKCVSNVSDCPARIEDSYDPKASDIQQTIEQLYRRRIDQGSDLTMIRARMVADKTTRFLTKPFSSHSFLITDIKQVRATERKPNEIMPEIIGYELAVIDPNFPQALQFIDYRFGDTNLETGDGIKYPTTNFIPYIHEEYDKDILPMKDSVQEYCKP